VENTFLLHVAAPGERPKILYWYRTVPGVKIGRPALDDAAMRSLEEQYPDIDFDWPYILDVGAMTPVEVEAAIPPRKRKPPPPRRAEADAEGEAGAEGEVTPPRGAAVAAAPAAGAEPFAPVVAADFEEGPDLLSELLGRGIAASLREQHATLAARIDAAVSDDAAKVAWRERLARLDPDRWESPEAVLAGMATVQRDVDVLTDELERATPGA